MAENFPDALLEGRYLLTVGTMQPSYIQYCDGMQMW